jgi:hypothetical protein
MSANRKNLLSLAALLASASIGLAYAAHPYRTVNLSAGKATEAVHVVQVRQPGAANTPEDEKPERLEVELITFNQRGFSPAEITRPAGRFVLAIDNRGGTRDVEFRLEDEAGGRLREVRLPARKRNWSEGVDLHPGRYQLTEANYPGARCLITITPPGNR